MFIVLFAAFVLSAMTAASCNFMHFTTVSDEAFKASNTDAITGEVTGVEDAGQIDASDFSDGDEEASVDEEIESAMKSTEKNEDDNPTCGTDGDRAVECGADAKEGRPSVCCDGFVCEDGGKKCVEGRRNLFSEESRALQSSYTTGLYRFPDPTRSDQCMTYPDSQTYDRAERAARAGAAIAPMCCAAVVFFLLFECLFCNIPCMKWFLALLLLTALICQGLTYLILGSTSFCNVNTIKDFYFELRDQNPCTVASGGIYSAFALLAYFVALVILCVSPKPEPVFCSKSGKDVNLSGADFRNEDGKAWTDPGAGTMT